MQNLIYPCEGQELQVTPGKDGDPPIVTAHSSGLSAQQMEEASVYYVLVNCAAMATDCGRQLFVTVCRLIFLTLHRLALTGSRLINIAM